MKSKKYHKILITGGAGFIGSFLADQLISLGYKVRILDNLEDQVHKDVKPEYLNKQAQFIKGDIRNYYELQKAIKEIDAVFHLAAAVGVTQSNYQIKKYVDTNTGGVANLLDILVNTKNKVKKLITISSMTGYGEGNYSCRRCGVVRPSLRNQKQLRGKEWNLYCPNCHNQIVPVPTDEKALDYPNSVYGLSKKFQQDLSFLIGNVYNIPVVVLRGFNIYGPRQSLSNPYTGVTAIFISRLKNNKEAVVFEDGLQTRDFVSVHDVVEAFVLSLEKSEADHQMFNIGSGRGTPILEIAKTISKLMDKKGPIKVNNEFRKNDIRHCFADISKAREILGWQPKIGLEEGFKELVDWSMTQQAEDKFSQARKELEQKDLI